MDTKFVVLKKDPKWIAEKYIKDLYDLKTTDEKECLDFTDSNKSFIFSEEVFIPNIKKEEKLILISPNAYYHTSFTSSSQEKKYLTNKNLDSSQLILLGLEFLSDIEEERLKSEGIFYYNEKVINKLGKELVNVMIDDVGNNNYHIVLDLRSFETKFTPSTFDQKRKGLIDLGLIIDFIKKIKDHKKPQSLTIYGFNPLKDDTFNRQTAEIVKHILIYCFDIKEKKINVFSEDSEFLIWRPLEQENQEADIGWYILRGIPPESKEKLLKAIPADKIITWEYENEKGEEESILLTKTTVKEQNEKSYLTATNIGDLALFVNEKIDMVFELIN